MEVILIEENGSGGNSGNVVRGMEFFLFPHIGSLNLKKPAVSL